MSQPTRNDLIGELPLPLAQLRHRARTRRDAHNRFWAPYYLWEATVKLLAATALTEYARTGARTASKQLESLARPSLGDWVDYLRLFKGRGAPGDPLARTAEVLFGATRKDLERAARLHAALGELLSGTDPARVFRPGAPSGHVRVDDFFRRLVTFRNQEIGHGAGPLRSESFHHDFGAALLGALDEVLPLLEVLTTFRLVYISAFRPRGNRKYEVEALDLTGDRPQHLGTERVELSPGVDAPGERQVYLAPRSPGAVGALDPTGLRSLHPLVLYEPDYEVVRFLNSKPGERNASYLCYNWPELPPSGEREANDLREAQREFLALLHGGDVSRERLADWAEQSFRSDEAARAGGTPPSGIVGETGRVAERPDPAPRRPEVSAALKLVLPALETAVRAVPGLTADVVAAAYQAAAPLGWAPRPEYQSDPVRAATDYSYNLAPAGSVNGAHPLLTFARALLAQADHCQPLADAIRDAGALLGEVGSVPGAPAPAPVPRPNPLLIVVWPHATEADKYVVKGWTDRPLFDEPRTCTRAELPAAVAQLYQKMPKAANRSEVWVEVFLPCDLVSEEVDRWEVSVGRLKRAVGCENPVLIRAADLYYDGELGEARAVLGERWRGVAGAGAVCVVGAEQLPHAHAKPAFVYQPAHPPNGKDLYNRLRRNPAVLGVALGGPPQEEAFNYLLHVGLPVVAWSRGCPAAALTALLDRLPLAGLPARVRDLRVEADTNADPAHAGNHIAVLYDDPTRPPPDVAHPLETPEPLHG